MAVNLPPWRPSIGDLVKSKNSRVLGVVVKCKPQEHIGASWIPERYVIWWLDTDKRTTEFVGSHGIDLIQVVSKARPNEDN